MSIYIAVRTAPKRIRRNLVGKSPVIGDRAASELTDIILKSLKGYEIVQNRSAPSHIRPPPGARVRSSATPEEEAG